jgi:hypothetical protein
VTREAFSPQTTFYPCRRRGRQAPNPVCALIHDPVDNVHFQRILESSRGLTIPQQ